MTVLRQETIDQLGHDPTLLKSKSNSKVVVQCPKCLGSRITKLRTYTNSMLRESPTSGFCKQCSCSHVQNVKSINNLKKIHCEIVPPNVLDDRIKKEFGYSFKNLAPGSPRQIYVSCPSCSSIYLRRRCRYRSDWNCNSCSGAVQVVNMNEQYTYEKRSAAQLKAQKHLDKINVHPIPNDVLDLETQSRFGYSFANLNPGSAKKIVVKCSACSLSREVRRHRHVPNGMCHSCNARETVKKIIPKPIYTPEQRKLVSNLRGLLGKAFNKHLTTGSIPQGKFKLLPYTPREFITHMAAALKEGCNICTKPIKNKFHISHVKPASSGNTVQEITESFYLPNLGAAHPFCNKSLGANTINI